jgi:hypothetical protein
MISARRRPKRIFNRRGKLLLIRDTDPWWKRLWGRICGRDVWHTAGFLWSAEIGESPSA